jgi:predicted aspartyl protease
MPAAAASCAVRRLDTLPVTMNGRLPTVHARIDGVDSDLVLDTGADRLLITEGAAAWLDLRIDPTRRGLSRGVNGDMVSRVAPIDRLILGSVDLGKREADIVPFQWPNGAKPLDGFLAGSILFIFDLDIDIPGRKVTLYYPRDCPGGAPPWPMPFTTLVAAPTMEGHAHLAIPATLEGQAVTATIDTGAETSVISRRVAARAGIDDAALARDPPIATYGFGPQATTLRLHRFNELRVGGERMIGRMMAVADLPEGAGDMLLGEDWLADHRVWLSFSSRRVYVARTHPP